MRHVAWLALFSAGCGSSGGPEHEPGTGAYAVSCDAAWLSYVAGALESPTGLMASATDAQAIAGAFGSLQEDLGAPGNRRPSRRLGIACPDPDPSGRVTCECSGGGTVVIESMNGKGGSDLVVDYRDCCIEPCCVDGCGMLTMTDVGSFPTCGVFAIATSCSELTPIEYSYCQDSSGFLWYLIVYLGETFAVRGYYESGFGGNWTVRDAATEWQCSEDESGSGSCTNDADELSW